jgi:antitoxin YefM
MKILPISEVKMKLNHLLEELGVQRDEVVITRNGRAAGVLVSPETFESWQETLAVLGDPELMGEIRAGLAALREGASTLPVEAVFGE